MKKRLLPENAEEIQNNEMIPDNRIEELRAQNLPILFIDSPLTSILYDYQYKALAYAHTGECLHQDTSNMMEQKNTHLLSTFVWREQ